MKRNRCQLTLLFPLVALLTASLLLFPLGAVSARAAGPLCYVDDTAAGANTGGSWTDAYTSLQSALADAGCTEIWVAAGVYRPGPPSGGQTSTFQLKSGVAIYGGFAGTETLRTQRNWTTNVAILSGDLDSSGTKTSNDAYEVVYGYNVNATAVLDGFTITGGYAAGASVDGAGIGLNSASPTLANLIVTGNTANGQGAGMLNMNGSSPSLSNVTFSGNVGAGSPSNGAGMYNIDSNPSLNNVTFSGNVGAASGSNGAGMYNYNSSPKLINVTFSGNRAGGNGGGIDNESSSQPTLTNVTFIGNVSTSHAGGGIFNESGCHPRLVNVRFIGNSAATWGGGMYSRGSNYSLTNGLLSGNTAANGGGMVNTQNTPTLTNVTFSHNIATSSGGGAHNYTSGNPTLNNVIMWGNSASSGAQIYNNSSTPVIAYSDIQDAFPGGNWDTSLGTNAGNNLAVDPLFRDADGVDNTYGTADDNLRLTKASPAANTGSSAALPADLADLDGDGNTAETLPLDLDLGGRVYAASVDMGPYEYRLWYVNITGASGNGCTSWADACPSLQTALGKAVYADEIWVAAGTYRPGASGANTATFQLKSGVAINGGFAGTESVRTARNWTTHVTILSGDLDSSGGLSGYDAFHVVTCSGVDSNAVLDGFTITGGLASLGSLPYSSGAGLYNDGGSPVLANLIVNGNAAAQGGGMYNNAASPALSNVTFSNNGATRGGGGMYNTTSSPSLTDVTFSSNAAGHWGTSLSSGGGMYNIASSPILTGGAFNNNTAEDRGAGVFNDANSNPTFTNVTFTGNHAGAQGGGMYNTASSPTLTGAAFSGNIAGSNGGGMDNEASSNPVLTNVTFSNNASTNEAGGGVFSDTGSHPTFTNVAFTSNSAATFGGGMYSRSGGYTMTGGSFTGNSAQYGGGLVNNNGVPTLANVTFSNNTATSKGGAIFNYESGSPVLSNVTINANSALAGGGMYSEANSNPSLTNVTFSSNTASGNGGGMDIEASCNATLISVTFSGNTSTTGAGGGLYASTSSSLTLTNTNFSSNSAATYGGGMYIVSSNYMLKGGIFNANQARYGGGLANNANTPTIVQTAFTGNTASVGGGGIYNTSSSPALTNVLFSSNTAGSGGGMYNTASSPTLVGVAFSLNRADYFGGGMENINSSSPSLVNVTVAHNHAGRFGGGVDNYLYSNPAFTNSVIGGNTAGQGGAQVLNYASTPSFTYSDIQGAYTSGVWDSALGIDAGYNLGSDPLFNTPSGRLGSASPALDIADAGALPADLYDLDGDGDTGEPLPLDLDGSGRLHGAGLDMGAYEFRLWYVDIDASGSGCTSWADACPDLQTALALPPGEIWVAEGIYRPGASGEVNAAFFLREGQALYGGFIGMETTRDQRDWVTHAVTLTGDLDASGGFSAGDAYHVVDASNTGSGVRLDGFTITGAYNDSGYGGGIYSYYGSPILANLIIRSNRAQYGAGIYNTGSPTLDYVTFTGNYVTGSGGGMDNAGGSPVLTHVTFSGNSAAIYGGGMRNVNGSPTLSDVAFSGNTALIGGGMWTIGGSPLLVNGIFVGNTAPHRLGGGGINCTSSSGSLTLVNVIFSHNTTTGNGGGMSNRSCSPTLVNVTFSHNAANGDGGGMYNHNANPALKNVIMWGNTAPEGSQIYNYNYSYPGDPPVISIPTIAYSDIQGSGGSGSWDAGLGVNLGGNIDADPLFVDANGADNIYGTLDDNLRLLADSPAIDAGQNSAVPADTDDLDGDGNTIEPLPYDLDGAPRFLDTSRPDTGSGAAPIVDIGAYETPEFVVNAGSDQSSVEGDLVLFTGSLVTPEAITAIAWDFGDGAGVTGVLTPTHTFQDNGVYTVTLTITSTLHGAVSDSLLVTVANADPVLGALGNQIVALGSPLAISLAYSDPGSLDTHYVEIDWGDGYITDGVIDPIHGLISGSHTYAAPDAAPGIYTLTLKIYDDDGGMVTLAIQMLVFHEHMIYLPLTRHQ